MRDKNVPKWRNCTGRDLKFVKMFDKFANDRWLSGTYKPIFLKSLLEIRHYVEDPNSKLVGKEWIRVEKNGVVVNLNFIATRFLKYYWDMEFSFKFRQSNDPNDVNILKTIREIDQGNNIKPWTIKEIAKESNIELRKKIINESIKPEAMHSLKKSIPKFWEREWGSMDITLDRGILGFFDRHHGTVSSIINHQLVTTLEKYNKITPRIATKVNHSRGQDRMYRQQIRKIEKDFIDHVQGDDLCFYCKKPRNKTNYDHVIPYNFVYSNDVYNIVASCRECNCIKHDRLPTTDLFDGVIERNKSLESMARNSVEDSSIGQDRGLLEVLSRMAGYAEDQYKILYESCAATQGSRERFRPSLIAG